MSDAREQREIKLREQVEHALPDLTQAPPEHREAAKQALEEALDAFNQFLREGRSEDQRDDGAAQSPKPITPEWKPVVERLRELRRRS